MWLISLVRRYRAQCPPFAGTDADGVLYRDDEDAPVAYLARLGGFQYRLDGFLYILSRTTMESRMRSIELVSYTTPR